MRRRLICGILCLAMLLAGCASAAPQTQIDPQTTAEVLTAATQPPTETTQPPTETTQSPTEATNPVPDGTLMLNGSWENGRVVIIAPDDTSLWIQLTDDRPDQEYNDLGTLWSLRFSYGESTVTEYSDHSVRTIPYQILLQSAAFCELGMIECRQGNLSPYIKEEHFQTLWLAKAILFSDGTHLNNPSVYTNLEIQREGNTYTAFISLPEWFDISAVDGMTEICVNLYDTGFWREFAQNGGASSAACYPFKPFTFYNND